MKKVLNAMTPTWQGSYPSILSIFTEADGALLHLSKETRIEQNTRESISLSSLSRLLSTLLAKPIKVTGPLPVANDTHNNH
jgi:hypothetical protein